MDEFEDFKKRVHKNRDEAHVVSYCAALLAFALATAFGRFEGITVCGLLMILSGYYALGANGNDWSPAYRPSARPLEKMTPEARTTRARFAGAWLIWMGALFVVGSISALFAH